MQVPPKLTSQFLKIERAVHDVSIGHVSVEQYAALVDSLAERFAKQLEAVRRIDIPPDFQPEIAQEMAVGTEGIKRYLDAMVLLRDYVGSRNLDVLSRGMEMAREANELVNEAMRLNWATYETYRQTAEEFLAQRGLA